MGKKYNLIDKMNSRQISRSDHVKQIFYNLLGLKVFSKVITFSKKKLKPKILNKLVFQGLI